jgi:hypothetical protein
MLNERIDRITGEFEQRSSTIVDGIPTAPSRSTTLKNSSDSLAVARTRAALGRSLVNKIDEAGNRLASRILTSGDKASDAPRRDREHAGRQGDPARPKTHMTASRCR